LIYQDEKTNFCYIYEKKKLKKYKNFFNKKNTFFNSKNHISLKNNWFKFSYNFKKLFNKYNINFVWFTGFENYFLSSILILQLYWIKLKNKKFNYKRLIPTILLRQYYYLTFFNIEYNFMLNKYLNRFKRNKYLTALFVKKKISLRKKYFLISQNFLKVYFSSLGASNGTALYEKSLFLYKKFMFKLTDSNYISSFIRLLSRKSRVKNIFNFLYLQKYIYNFFFLKS